MKRWLILVSILLPMSTFVSANSSDEIQQLEMKVEQLRVEAERAELNYLEAKNKLEQLKKRSQTSRKVGERTGDKPCTCVFNNKRMWNPEKILWDNKFYKCGHYLEDGTCEYVEEMKDVSIKNVQ
ncbi:hypothetical protein [Vibrio hepatarius]|jgi:hypothetical protein|uniref:hypothetical protein n=1 Tax=Vibrio hepatarius TaxID=171383 RepID=UPI0006A96325|nr:hypothetical protein [Vibrio hepatarius]NOI13292.1 hypothetical protein [Vibrio hepatarius]